MVLCEGRRLFTSIRSVCVCVSPMISRLVAESRGWLLSQHMHFSVTHTLTTEFKDERFAFCVSDALVKADTKLTGDTRVHQLLQFVDVIHTHYYRQDSHSLTHSRARMQALARERARRTSGSSYGSCASSSCSESA